MDSVVINTAEVVLHMLLYVAHFAYGLCYLLQPLLSFKHPHCHNQRLWVRVTATRCLSHMLTWYFINALSDHQWLSFHANGPLLAK